MNSPRHRFSRWILITTIALCGTLTWAGVALAANEPSISGANTDVFGATAPVYTIQGDLSGDMLSWELSGPGGFAIAPVSQACSAPDCSDDLPISTGALPLASPPGGAYTLTARQTLSIDGTVGTATRMFTIATPLAPTVNALAPNPTNSPTPTFTWSGEPDGTYTWEILLNGVLAQTGTTTATAPSATPSALATGAYTFQVRQTNALQSAGPFSAPLAFTVDLAAPTGGAIAHAPAANRVAGFTRPGTPVSINLTTASVDNLAGTITYALTTAATPVPAVAAFSAWAAARTVSVATTNGAITTVFLWARDAVGNISPAPVASTTITFDSQAPSVLATSFPVPGTNVTTAFGTLANVQINFSEPVQNPAPLIRMCVNPCGLPVAAAVTYSEITGPVALLDPTATLAIGTTYEIELPAVRDRAGNTLTGPGSTAWTFTTSADGTPPGVVTGLTAVAGIGQVALTWKPPTDADLARITVLRSTIPPTSAGDGTAARFSLPANGTGFTDVALSPGVTYYYAVYAEDAVGNPSELARTTAVPKAPLVPIIKPGPPKPPKGIFDKFMTPRKGKVLGTLRPILKWRRNLAAQLYNIQILDLNTNRKVVSAFPKKPAYRVPAKRLKPGHRYAWRVWAYRGKRKGYVKVPMTTWFDTSPKAK